MCWWFSDSWCLRRSMFSGSFLCHACLHGLYGYVWMLVIYYTVTSYCVHAGRYAMWRTYLMYGCLHVYIYIYIYFCVYLYSYLCVHDSVHELSTGHNSQLHTWYEAFHTMFWTHCMAGQCRYMCIIIRIDMIGNPWTVLNLGVPSR